MNQDGRLQGILARFAERWPLQPVPLDPDLAEPSSFLKILRARHMNWTAPKFRKIFGMRFDVKVPPLEQMNFICYPDGDHDLPVFIFFCLETRRKLIAHLNVNCPFDDSAYQDRYVRPLVARLSRYPSFACDDRYPTWMQKYRNEATIFGMFPKERGAAITACMFDYLDEYLARVRDATPVADPVRRRRIADFQAQFVEDIRTQDKARGMIGKMIGAEKAQRIFYEITT